MKRFLGQEDGQAAVEYAVLAVFISIAAIVLLQILGVGVAALYQATLDGLP